MRADNSRAEHDEVKNALYELDHMHVAQDDFDQQLDRVMAPLMQHMAEEEQSILPQLAQSCWERELVELGDQFQSVKSKLPTHPHPYAPNRPPMETVVAYLTAPLDKAFDAMVRDFPETVAR
jgi:hypothetical protein